MTRQRPRPSDHDVRVRATTDFTTNLVVSAGAGTGKTTLLVERILSAIGSGHAPLSSIAAITFTDKAAGELRHRLASGLRELAALARGESTEVETASANNAFAWLTGIAKADGPTIAARAEEAETNLDRATVATIHGFCADILRAHPLESGLPPGFAVDRGLAGRRLAAEEWDRFLKEELGAEGRREELWARVIAAFGLTRLGEIARVMAGGATSSSALNGTFPRVDVQQLLGPDALRLADEIREAVARAEGLADAPRTWFREAHDALRAFATTGATAARDVIDRSTRFGEETPKIGKKVSPSDADALQALERRTRPFARAMKQLDEAAETDLMEALLPFARRLRAAQARLGLVDFDGLLVRARDLLRDQPALRETWKRRYRMILVDEFQDTDPIQYDIVFFLAEKEGDHAADAYATRLAPGRLFIVGDAKQSIYRFRGADYAAYRRAVAHVLDRKENELSLTSNFRSTAAILDPINVLFAEPGSTLWKSSAYQTLYKPIVAERGDDGGPAVEVWTTDVAADASADERRRSEALALAAEVSAMAGPGKRWRFGDVLVLFRGFSELNVYLRALREADVPFVVSGGRRFFERTEIVQAMAVLRAVAEPDDQVALLSFRRSPAGGVPDTELAAAAADGAAFPTLAAADERLSTLRAEALKLPVDTAVRYVLEASGLFALSGLAFEAAQRIANLEKLAMAASELARDGRIGLKETLEALDEGFEADDEGDSPLADAEQDAVRVMTIHKAKGLEAPVVILPDTAAGRSSSGPRRFESRLVRVGSGEFVALTGPKFVNGAAIAASLDDAPHLEAEDVRLLYVALTRARDRLCVFGDRDPDAPWSRAIAEWTTGVEHRTTAVTPARARTAAGPPDGAPAAVSRFEKAAAAVTALSAPPFHSPSDTEPRLDPALAVEESLEPELAREVGRIAHAKLAGFPVASGGDALREADALLRAFHESPAGRRFALLQVLGREVPMLLDEGDARWLGTIDMIYRDPEGAIVVADFKTDATDDGAIERHGLQLDIYARAVRRAMPGERVRAELWMLRSGRVIEV